MVVICEFIRKHCWAVSAAFIVLIAADGLYILKQRDLQDDLIAELVEPGSVSPALIITAQPRESSFFERRDRLRVTVASSILSDNPAEAPITLDFDVVAHFGPFGLTGDIFALNDTPSSARLLAALEGRHPRLSMRYGWSLFSDEFRLAFEATPFDMRLGTVTSGVGPMTWHLASSEPIKLSLTFSKSRAKSKFSAANLLTELTDPAGNVLSFKTKDAAAENLFDLRETPAGGLEWFLVRNNGRAEQVEVLAGDWRGGLTAVFRDVRAQAHQEAAQSESVISGRYNFRAEDAEVKLLVNRESALDRKLELEAIELDMHAENVPVALMRPVDDVELERIVRESGLMHLAVKPFTFKTDKGETATFTAELTSGMRDGHKPTIEASIETRVPESVMRLSETVLRGSRRALSELELADFMKREVSDEGNYYSLDLKASLEEGVILNGTPLLAPIGTAAPERFHEAPLAPMP